MAIESLTELIEAIRGALGPCSGLDSEEVDHNELLRLMDAYSSNVDDWAQYALFDPSRNYTRNLVDDTNGKSNILVVAWVSFNSNPLTSTDICRIQEKAALFMTMQTLTV